MVLLIGRFRELRFHHRLHEEAKAQTLSYLAYLLVPARGLEGLFVEVGQPFEGSRNVASLSSHAGRAELHWPSESTYTSQQAVSLLAELQPADSAALSERLHSTICQSLTAAHLHLELGLMSRPEGGEEFEVARQLVHEATTSVRELIDELAGGES